MPHKSNYALFKITQQAVFEKTDDPHIMDLVVQVVCFYINFHIVRCVAGVVFPVGFLKEHRQAGIHKPLLVCGGQLRWQHGCVLP